MMTRIAAVITAVLLGGVVVGHAEQQLPIGPVPEFGLAKIADGTIEIVTCVSRPVDETQTRLVRTVFDNHTVVEQQLYTVRRWVSEVRATKPTAFRVYQGDKQTDAATAARLLASQTPVVIVKGEPGSKPHAFYVQFLKPETIIVGVEEPLPTPVEPLRNPDLGPAGPPLGLPPQPQAQQSPR